MVERLPIIYVRGFAGGTSGIDSQVDDPFYGFNLGSTHVRVGGSGDPIFYQFESPLLRLILDHDYELFVRGDQRGWLEDQPDRSVAPDSIWIHRFYDVSASTWGEKPQDFSLERAAEDLLRLVELVRAKTGAPQVNLVAHSMGGLICRCLLQRVIRDLPPGPDGPRTGAELVARLFTYATPHGGIEFDVGSGALEKLRDTFGVGGGQIFGPQRMWEYLTPTAGRPERPPEGWRACDMPDSDFPSSRVFSLIGTNPGDYGAALGLSSKAVGAKSDGLVQIENAYVPGTHRAFVHRSHSGRYGIVNSEEGYQNLRRFLFGSLEVQADLDGVRLPRSDGDDDVVWQAEAELSVRGLPVLMHQQVAAHHCPVQLDPGQGDTADRPVPLVTTFLLTEDDMRPDAARPMRYALHLKVLSLRMREGLFRFFDHLEQTADFDDLLVVDVTVGEDGMAAWATWNSQIAGAVRDHEPSGPPLTDEDPRAGEWVARIPLPDSARAFLGDDAAVSLRVRGRR